MTWLDHIKIGLIHTGSTIKEQTVQAINDTKIQGTVIFGTFFGGQVTASEVITYISGVASLALVIKLAFDVKKSMADTRKTELEYEIMQTKENERKKRLEEAEETGHQPRRKNDHD
jgi:hypothetical protein